MKVFLYNDKLKFNQIEKLTNLRSNVLAYYLKNFLQQKIIVKEGEEYFLSEESETIIPYVSDKQSPLTVILVAIGGGKKFFLQNRQKRPYKDLLGLPAGRILVGESIGEAVKRIMKQKYGVNARLSCVNSVSLEHIKKNGKVINSFLHILVSASTKDKIKYMDIEKSKSKMIKSDYWFLKNHQKERCKIKNINSNT